MPYEHTQISTRRYFRHLSKVSDRLKKSIFSWVTVRCTSASGLMLRSLHCCDVDHACSIVCQHLLLRIFATWNSSFELSIASCDEQLTFFSSTAFTFARIWLSGELRICKKVGFHMHHYERGIVCNSFNVFHMKTWIEVLTKLQLWVTSI